MKNNMSCFFVISIVSLLCAVLQSADFEKFKHRTLGNHKAREVILACDEHVTFVKDLAIQHAQDCIPEVWSIDALKNHDKSEFWNLVVMRTVDNCLKTLLYSPKTQYSFTLNYLPQELQDYILSNEKK